MKRTNELHWCGGIVLWSAGGQYRCEKCDMCGYEDIYPEIKEKVRRKRRC